MKKPSPEQLEQLEQLRAAYEQARAQGAANRDAVIAAWNALDAAHIAVYGPQKRTGYACRAGKRQAAERKARR